MIRIYLLSLIFPNANIACLGMSVYESPSLELFEWRFFCVGGLAHGRSLRPPRAAIGAIGRDTLRGQSWRAGVLQAAGPEIAGPGCRIAAGNRRPKRNKMKKK